MLKTTIRAALLCMHAVGLLVMAGCELRTAAVPRPLQPYEAPKEQPEVPSPDAAALRLLPGFRAEAVVVDLTYPSSAAFDEQGNLYIAEAGYVYGDAFAPKRIWRVSQDGGVDLAAEQGLEGPITDLLWHEGQLYVSHRGKISVLEQGQVRDLVTGLPSLGDHHNNQLTVGPDGWLYVGQGTATNSGVVGVDNFVFGWLPLHPNFHDQPARDIRVRNQDYATLNPFILAGGIDTGPMMTTTSPFRPFGQAGEETIPGAVKANGTILRMRTDGSGLEVYAWGLRNPFGVMWAGDVLYATENGFDQRGSRPIENDPDDLYIIRQGAWYGWPDYAAGIPVTDERFRPEGGPAVEFLMQEHPPVEKPVMTFPPHSAVTKLAVSPGGSFGDQRDLFMAAFGPMTPVVGILKRPALGPAVVRLNPAEKRTEVFVGSDGPAGLRRPMDVIFSPDGQAMYVVDLGAVGLLETRVPMAVPYPGTGVVWRIVPENAQVTGPPAGVSVIRRERSE